jgi:CRISPR system Cascade subunit CasC
MSDFIQLHLLTSYAPANLNRDDLGRPKTAVMGGVPRLRVSSQSLKRAWRTSDVFDQKLSGYMGLRTKEVGLQVFEKLIEKGVKPPQALVCAKRIAGVFGKLDELSKKEKEELKKLDGEEKINKQKKELRILQLAHIGTEEQAAIDALISKIAESGEELTDQDLDLLRKKNKAVDIALFGRMLADATAYNVEAAAQVAHAISVHRVTVEDDFFTAVDDLNLGREDSGASHLGETEFAAGVLYQYVCIDRQLLVENLGDDSELAEKTIAALIETAATVAPTGKQNSFASRAYASYVLCERGDAQPRSLSVAFLKPVSGSDFMEEAIDRLEQYRENLNKVYGTEGMKSTALNASKGQGSLSELVTFASKG